MALGFEDVEVTKYSGDGGIDVRADLSVGGVTEVKTAVQVKRWANNVSGKTVRELRGGLGPHERGLIITLSDFTKDARREAAESDRSPISLINGELLIDFLIEHEVGVVRRSATILQIDEGAISEQMAEAPESVDSPRRAPQRHRVIRSTKSLSVWPLPGGGDHWKTTLDQMLRHVAANAPSMSEAIDWLISSYDRVNSTKSARGYWQVLRSFGLIESEGEQLVLTADGVTYIDEPTPSALFEQMGREIAGTDELLALLADRSATVDELRHHMNEVLGTQWESDAQVKFRLGWLAILGVVHLEGDRASLASVSKSSTPAAD